MQSKNFFQSISELSENGQQRNSSIKFLFVCRGSTSEGLGHVTRSVTIIRQLLRDYNSVKLIIIGDDFAAELAKNLYIEVKVIKQDREVLSIFDAFRPDIVFFDLNHFDYEIFKELAKRCFIVGLSPLFQHLDRVDIVFNRTIYTRKGIELSEDRMYLGLQYSVITDNGIQISEKAYMENLTRKVFSVGISMGGTDAANKTLRVLEKVKELDQPAIIWCLLGEGYSHSYEELVSRAKENGRHEIILAKTVQSMWHILQNCSVVVLAGGVTTYEAVYAGMPSINLFETQDDFFLIRELTEKNCAVNAGVLSDDNLAKVKENLELFNLERWRLMNLHRRTKGLVDKYGANRIIDDTLAFYRKQKLLGIIKGQAEPVSDFNSKEVSNFLVTTKLE